MPHLAHPFDDAFFAALATGRGVARDDLPTGYDPGEEWGNDGLDQPVPGMEAFTFICGDEEWYGRMAIYAEGFTYRRLDAHVVEIVMDARLSETQGTALVGMPCSSVINAPCIGPWIVTRTTNNPDDADQTVIMLAVP